MEPERIAVGLVTRVHGLSGEVAVQSLTDVTARFDPGSTLQLEDGRSLRIVASRPHVDRTLVTFDGVPDRTAAEGLRGAYLFVDAASLQPLPEGSYWPHDLEGCSVETEDGRPLGTIAEVLQGPANDVWAVEGEAGRRWIPAVRHAVLEVDLAGRRIVVREEALA
jgi:16S rRNA processing protein RimM